MLLNQSEETKMKIFFRFNCGDMWGHGHLIRNVEIIKQMSQKEYTCEAIINNYRYAIETLDKLAITYTIVDEFESADTLISILQKRSCDSNKYVFWDRLDSNTEYMSRLIKAGVRVLTYDNYDRSALLSTICINTRNIPIEGKILRYSGPKYQIMREEISQFAVKEKTIRRDINKICLHFGGTDPLRILEKCFNALNTLSDCNIEFIGGKENDLVIVKNISRFPKLIYERNINDFGRKLYESDICVLAGGVSMYEASTIGTPMINICQNEDQNFAAELFKKNVGSINLGVANSISQQDIYDAVISLINNYEKRKKMSNKMKEFVPPDGSVRVCKIIEDMIETDRHIYNI